MIFCCAIHAIVTFKQRDTKIVVVYVRHDCLSVEDPGFPRGGAENLLFELVLPKNSMEMKTIWTQREGARP